MTFYLHGIRPPFSKDLKCKPNKFILDYGPNLWIILKWYTQVMWRSSRRETCCFSINVVFPSCLCFCFPWNMLFSCCLFFVKHVVYKCMCLYYLFFVKHVYKRCIISPCIYSRTLHIPVLPVGRLALIHFNISFWFSFLSSRKRNRIVYILVFSRKSPALLT